MDFYLQNLHSSGQEVEENSDGAAFFICGSNEELAKEIDKKMDKFVSISEINHGDYDMKFFAY